MLDTRHPGFGVVEFTGSAHDRGFQYGEKFAENISEILDRSYGFYKTAAGLSKDQVLKTSAKFWPYIQEYSDEIAQELKGLSEGSKRAIEEIALLASFNEIQFYYAFARIPRYGRTTGCTSFCVTGPATVNGETIIGQNNDGSMHPNLDEYDFLMKLRTDSGVDLLTLTLMGCTSFVGVNSKGIGLCINAVSDGDFRVGVPFSTITRGILGSKNIGEAINAVITAERGAGANYLIADENGECYDIETTARNYNCYYIEKNFGHANHYLTRATDQRDITPRRVDANTIVRCNRMNKLLGREFGKTTVETCFGLLKDHVNYPTSICVHPNPDLPPEMAMKTMDSIVISPAKREMHVTRDNPCKTDFKKYSLQ